MKRASLCSAALCALLAFPSVALASPLLPDTALAPQARRALAEQVRAERASHPELFQRLRSLGGVRPEVYLRTRAQRPAVTRELQALGPGALFPMLDVLALSGYPQALGAEETVTLQVGLLEALGALQDRRAQPALRGAFEALTDPAAVGAAARALGGLCTDDEVAYLTTAGARGGMRGLAAWEGLGACRRVEAVRVLADALDRATDRDTMEALARGLSDAGSTWARAARGQTDDGPSVAARALLRAFLRADAATRPELQVALSAVGAPETPQLVAEARRAPNLDASTQRALESLERVLRRSRPR
ncbi:MAG: hypothetical protein HY909_09515 [Deltaproteobacteria bacterium]|nr:hypothetical protein [Deltaproteobacteria bacterium]